MKQTIINNITIRCEFIDLIDRLERINYDYVDLNELNNFIYYDNKNNQDGDGINSYKIAKVINNKETYIFQYKKTNGDNYEFVNIPNAEFHPNTEYDFSLDLVNKIFKKTDEYVDIELHTVINIDTDMDIQIDRHKKNKSLLRKILGC
jgi:hypothetical protein